jgi:hypothetical protein
LRGPVSPRREPAALPEGFWQEEHDPRQFHSGFAFDRALERLATHPAIWPVVLELTGGRPHLLSGNLCVDRVDIYTAGITLHCGREDDNPADPADLPHLEATAEGELRCNNFVFFPCESPPSSATDRPPTGPLFCSLSHGQLFAVCADLDDCFAGDGGLLVLPGSRARLAWPFPAAHTTRLK